MSSIADNAQSPDQLLRSAAEIGRVVDALAAQHSTLTAQLEGEGAQFSSCFMLADPERQFTSQSASSMRGTK